MISDSEIIPENLQGYFLISEVDLHDPNFYHSVILITDHNPSGAFGLVVNRPANVLLQDLVPVFSGSTAGAIPVYVGGPVEQQYLFVLHDGIDGLNVPEPKIEPVPGVIFQPLTETMARFLIESVSELSSKTLQKRIHVFAGYSGWSTGQLESELRAESWYTIPATADIIFHSNPSTGWQDALSRKGDLYSIIAQTGFKPSRN